MHFLQAIICYMPQHIQIIATLIPNCCVCRQLRERGSERAKKSKLFKTKSFNAFTQMQTCESILLLYMHSNINVCMSDCVSM